MKKRTKLDQDPRDKGRTVKEVSDDIQDAASPVEKTPQEMNEDPEKVIDDKEVTGD